MTYLTDEIGLKQVAKYNLKEEYLMARRHGCNIIEALEEWDHLTDEFLKEYDGYELPKPTFKDRLKTIWIYIRYPFLATYYKIKCKKQEKNLSTIKILNRKCYNFILFWYLCHINQIFAGF